VCECDISSIEEFRQLIKSGVFRKINKHNIPYGRKPLKGRWVFKTKFDSAGKAVRFKARWVVKGYLQQEGVDYFETFASVVRFTTFKIVMALVALHKLHCHQIDMVTAFLNGKLLEEVFMEVPHGFEDEMGCQYVKLLRTLYGLKQSPRYWYDTLKASFFKISFVPPRIYDLVVRRQI
jgi:hypothetical protein